MQLVASSATWTLWDVGGCTTQARDHPLVHLDRDRLSNWVRWDEPLEMFNRNRLPRRVGLGVEVVRGRGRGEADAHSSSDGNQEQ
jgi:hypothetical protein